MAWLAGFEPQTCAVVAGLVARAAAAATSLRPAGRLASLDAAQLATAGQALADAIEYRQPSGALRRL